MDGHSHRRGEQSDSPEGHEQQSHPERLERALTLVGVVALIVGWGVEWIGPDSATLSTLLYITAFVSAGSFAVWESVDKLRRRKFDFDSLTLLAAIGAAILGKWAEGALLLVLFRIGHTLEEFAAFRAGQAIEALGKLAPDTAWVRRGTDLAEVPTSQLQLEDVIVIRSNDRIPADGFVLKGSSHVDQSSLTGESIPVEKRSVENPEIARRNPLVLPNENRVFAGTLNQNGSVEVEVTKLAGESTLSRLVELVREAETRSSTTQRFTEQFEKWFVPTVVGFVLVFFFILLALGFSLSIAFYRTMAVLVAASPCALAISTPSAILSGLARAARGGVLIKGGAPLELLGTVSSLALDKTGTLTSGLPQVTDVIPSPSIAESNLLAIATAVERLSDHPLAKAVVKYVHGKFPELNIPEASDLNNLTGRGLTAVVQGESVWLGKPAAFNGKDFPQVSEMTAENARTLQARGRTCFILRKGEFDLGVIGLMDSPRPTAAQLIRKLRKLGIQQLLMISGDHQAVADAIAQEVGLDEAKGDLLPEDKVRFIQELKAKGPVGMVGDGVNDAPAMAQATVGIAMGAAGSDVAMETADVALMSDRLEGLPFVIGLSRRTRSIISQNLMVSLGMVAILIPATAFGLGLGPAVILHEGSTLLVVFNALRLLAYRESDV